MKVLVAYMSQTGNTKKVADAIYDALPQLKEIKPIKDVTTLEGYDLTFLGFPTHAYGPDKPVKNVLDKLVKGRTIALFITHMAPDDAPPVKEYIQKFRDAAVGANIVGFFDCQGQASLLAKIIVSVHPDPKVRASAKASKGQPDAARLERARTFADEMMNKLRL